MVLQFWRLFRDSGLDESVVDLACGDGRNGIFLANQGIPVVLIDRSASKLERAGRIARSKGAEVDIKRLDLEQGDVNPLLGLSAGGILVFRYLHRPLIPAIKGALKVGGILIYETFTRDQTRYGRPHNADYLLRPGELKAMFAPWDVIHYFEGIMDAPKRAIAQIVCRKSGAAYEKDE